MTRRSTFPPLVVLILAVLIATTSTSQAIVPEHGPSASGSGNFNLRNQFGNAEVWSFSFEALSNKNGQAHGQAQFDDLTAQTQVIMRINCLSVEDSAFAVMSGRVLRSNDPDRPKGEVAVFAASDGELLPTPSFDTITPPFSFPGHDCHGGQPLTILPVENGDIEILP